MTTLKDDEALRADQPATGDSGPEGFAKVFDGDATGGIEPYVRLVPPDGDEIGATGQSELARATPLGSTGRATFRPEEIESSDYRLLARALTNADVDTHHLAAMTLVQLVKFLRAAGVSVPNFPDTGSVADPGTSASAADQAERES